MIDILTVYLNQFVRGGFTAAPKALWGAKAAAAQAWPAIWPWKWVLELMCYDTKDFLFWVSETLTTNRNVASEY